MSPLAEARDLVITYETPSGPVRALDEVSVKVREGRGSERPKG